MRYRRRRSAWREPERPEGQHNRDARFKNRKYFVYVLETDSGHYVGHTYSVRNRFAQHKRGDVQSTQGTNPKLVWKSRACATRKEAADFEAALKSLRDQEHPKFHEITGYYPQPWVFNNTEKSGGFRPENPIISLPNQNNRRPLQIAFAIIFVLIFWLLWEPQEPPAPPTSQTSSNVRSTPEGAPLTDPAVCPTKTHTIKLGDTLSSIAISSLGSANRWIEIHAANPGIDPEKLRVGTILILPCR